MYEYLQAVLDDLNKANLEPNAVTFTCLAMGCFEKSDALALLTDMKVGYHLCDQFLFFISDVPSVILYPKGFCKVVAEDHST